MENAGGKNWEDNVVKLVNFNAPELIYAYL